MVTGQIDTCITVFKCILPLLTSLFVAIHDDIENTSMPAFIVSLVYFVVLLLPNKYLSLDIL